MATTNCEVRRIVILLAHIKIIAALIQTIAKIIPKNRFIYKAAQAALGWLF